MLFLSEYRETFKCLCPGRKTDFSVRLFMSATVSCLLSECFSEASTGSRDCCVSNQSLNDYIKNWSLLQNRFNQYYCLLGLMLILSIDYV